MDECGHEDIEESSHIIEYYGVWRIVTVRQCENCDEIIDESFSEF